MASTLFANQYSLPSCGKIRRRRLSVEFSSVYAANFCANARRAIDRWCGQTESIFLGARSHWGLGGALAQCCSVSGFWFRGIGGSKFNLIVVIYFFGIVMTKEFRYLFIQNQGLRRHRIDLYMKNKPTVYFFDV